MEHPTKITDSSGFKLIMEYDEEGRIETFGHITEKGKLVSNNIDYNKDGLITDIETPLGTEKRRYASDGVLKSVEVMRKDLMSEAVFDAHGRITNLLAFDGGETKWSYEPDEDGARLKSVELANDERLNYSWGDNDGMRISDVNIGSIIVRTRSDAEGRVRALTWGKGVI